MRAAASPRPRSTRWPSPDARGGHAHPGRRVAEAGADRDRRRYRCLRPRSGRATARSRPRRRDRLARPDPREGARGHARRRRRDERGRRAGGRLCRPRSPVVGRGRDGARPRRRDRPKAGPLRRQRSEVRAGRRLAGTERGTDRRGRRQDGRRAGRVRLPGRPRRSSRPPRIARRGRARLRRGRRERAGAGVRREAGERARARRGSAGELTRARVDDRGDPPREPAVQGRRGCAPDRLQVTELRVIPLAGMPEVEPDDDLAELVAGGAALEDGAVVVLAQKIVSKAEGRVVRLDEVEPSERARELAGDEDPRRIEVILRELTGRDVAVLVTDSFGRPWRQGTTDVAIGASGLRVLIDLRGVRDRVGYELHATTIAVADEIAGAAELVMGKTDGIPGAVVRGLSLGGEGRARDLVMPPERDLFR